MKTINMLLIGGGLLAAYLWWKNRVPQAPTPAQIQQTWGAGASQTSMDAAAAALRAAATTAPTVSANGTVNIQTLGSPLSPTGSVPGLAASAFNGPILPPALNPQFTAPGSGFAISQAYHVPVRYS